MAFLKWYFKLLVRRPFTILSCIFALSVTCIVIVLTTTQKLPNFSEPTLGFESRGTELGKRAIAWRNIVRNANISEQLIQNPRDIIAAAREDLLQALPESVRNDLDRLSGAPKYIRPKKKLRKSKRQSEDGEFGIIHYTTNDTSNTTAAEDNSRNNGQTDSSIVVDDVQNQYERNVNTSSLNEWDDENSITWVYGVNKTEIDEERYRELVRAEKTQWNFLVGDDPPPPELFDAKRENYFCGEPSIGHSRVVLEHVNVDRIDRSLFELDALKAMCQLEFDITNTKSYRKMCETKSETTACCRPWSLPNYVALVANLDSCSELTERNVVATKRLLLQCGPYLDEIMKNNCQHRSCNAPAQCVRLHAVYDMLNYLGDDQFVPKNTTSIANITLRTAMLFLPLARSTKNLPVYYDLHANMPYHKDVGIVAIEMGLKDTLFDNTLLQDSWMILLGALFISMCMYIYLRSFWLTCTTLIAIVFSLSTAYFVYQVIFQMPFFPFMNLLAVVVVLGIGADDAFIFMKIWHSLIADQASPLPINESGEVQLTDEALTEVLAETWRQAAMSMGVTTITTAIALGLSYFNAITAIMCFGIFASTAVICNYILMLTWMPACVVFSYRFCTHNCTTWPTNTVNSHMKAIRNGFDYVENQIVWLVTTKPWIWIVSFGALSAYSAYIVCISPGLLLPESGNIQLFASTHLFERYDNDYSKRFVFEKTANERDLYLLPLRFIWGVRPVDNGRRDDPTSLGHIEMDETFNMTAVESQQWLRTFCRRLRRQPFFEHTTNSVPIMAGCAIDTLIDAMHRRPCIDHMTGDNYMPCCEQTKFPYTPAIIEECMPDRFEALYESPRFVFQPTVGGPRFARVQLNTTHLQPGAIVPVPRINALVVDFESNVAISSSYPTVQTLRRNVEAFLRAQLASAPVGMANAWFTSDLQVFDVQETLTNDTAQSICISMLVSLVVLIAVTRDLLTSLLAMVTIALTICSTVAFLVGAFSWRLNVLESIAISTSIGLTIDFSLHYGNAFRECQTMKRTSTARAEHALRRMLGPSTMAAITTGAAGAFMLPSEVLAYVQIGQFLCVVMVLSWAYATFFLMSALTLCGRQEAVFLPCRWFVAMQRRCYPCRRREDVERRKRNRLSASFRSRTDDNLPQPDDGEASVPIDQGTTGSYDPKLPVEELPLVSGVAAMIVARTPAVDRSIHENRILAATPLRSADDAIGLADPSLQELEQ